MNMKKTKTMWVKKSKLENAESGDYEITINGSTLSHVYSYFYLGVEIDDGLSYDKHLNTVVNCDESVSRGRMTGTRGRGTGKQERRDEPSERRNEE